MPAVSGATGCWSASAAVTFDSQVDHPIAIRQFDLVWLSLAQLCEIAVLFEAMRPLAFGVMMSDERAFDPALDGAFDGVLDAAVSPIHAWDGRK